MADVKISGLPVSTVPLTGAEVLPIVQSAVTKQVSVANVQAAPVAAGLANGVQYLDASKVPSTNANISFNGTNLLLGTTTSVVRATVSGADASPPALGTAAGTAFFSNTNPGYGLLIGTSTGGWSWMQSQRVSGAATAFDLILQPTSGGVNIGDSTSGIGAGNLRLGTGNLVIGTSGKGIDFSATPGTGTSELLADYEEGTWTPVVTATTGTITSYTATGTYTKVGRMVYCSLNIQITNNGTGSGSLRATLPFSSAVPSTGLVREVNLTGSAMQLIVNVGTTFDILTLNNAYPAITGYGLLSGFTYSV